MPDIKEKRCRNCDWFTDAFNSGTCANPDGKNCGKLVGGSEHCEKWAEKVEREKPPIKSKKPMTNADRLNAMSIEDKAQFLYSIAYARETPWSKPFYEKFCKDCPAPEYTLDDGRKLCLHECEFKDGKCPHGTDIVWWLQQPAEEDTVSEKCTSIEVQHERR